MEVDKFRSVQKWLAAKDYKRHTIARNVTFCSQWCGILGLTPDQIIKADPVECQNKIAEALRNKRERFTISVHLSTFHQFLRANDVFKRDPELEEIVLNIRYPTWLRTSANLP